MANALITPTIIANEMMMQLENNLVIAKLVNRDYEDEFTKIGDTIQIRRPVKFSVTNGPVMQVQDVEEGNIPLQINTQKHVAFSFSSKDKTLTVDKFSERYIKPVAIALANDVEQAVFSLFSGVSNYVGTPGTTFSGFASPARAAQRLVENGVPQDGVNLVMSPADNFGMLNNFTGLFISDVSKTALEKAKLPMIAGLDNYMSQNVPTFTTGVRGGTPLVNGANQAVTYAASKAAWSQTLLMKGGSASIANWARAGDVFTIAGVFDVSPVARAVQTRLKQFAVLSAATTDGTGNVTLTISPPIIVTGPQQTASAVPADNAALTFVGSAATAYAQNLAFHRNAFTLAIRPLEIHDGAPPGSRIVRGEGIAMRMIPVFDGINDFSAYRFDILYGVKTVYPELACRVAG